MKRNYEKTEEVVVRDEFLQEVVREDEEISNHLFSLYPELKTLEEGRSQLQAVEDLNNSATIGSEFGSFNVHN
jgi:hypothetical protein